MVLNRQIKHVTFWGGGAQSQKKPVGALALPTGKFLRVRKVFARLQCNGSLKGPHFSAQCKPCPGKMDGFKLFASEQFKYCLDSLDTVRTVWILSGRFRYCPDGFNSVRTVSILSGWFQYSPDGFNTVGTVSILSGRFQYCLDGFNTVRTVSILSGRFQYCHKRYQNALCTVARGIYARCQYVARENYALVVYVANRVITHFIRKTFARKKPLSGKF